MPFPNCETKDKILINYEYDEYRERNYEEDDEEEEGDFEEFLEKVKDKGLTDDEKIKILEYYEVFKDDMKNWCRKISQIVNRPEEMVEGFLKSQKFVDKKHEKKEEKREEPEEDQEFKIPSAKAKFNVWKDALKEFIKILIWEKYEFDTVLEFLSYFKMIIEEYLDFEKSKEKMDRSQLDE